MKRDTKALPMQNGIEVREYRHGAWSGEFPTIIVVTLSMLAGGILSAVGKDIWEALKGFLKKRFDLLEKDRQSKKGTREPRSHVLVIYIVGELEGIPVVYYSAPLDGEIRVDFGRDQLLRAEAKIGILIRAGKISSNKFLGISLQKLGSERYLSIFHAIPSQRTMDGPGSFAPDEEKTIEEIEIVLRRKT
jgi:hypothetical protein